MLTVRTNATLMYTQILKNLNFNLQDHYESFYPITNQIYHKPP